MESAAQLKEGEEWLTGSGMGQTETVCVRLSVCRCVCVCDRVPAR